MILGGTPKCYTMEHSFATAAVCDLIPLDLDPQQGAGVARPVQVLLVEDDAEAAELVQIGLSEDSGDPFRVEWSQNLISAMNRLVDPGIDVILLDLGLPELTGYRTYRAIEAAADHRVPVVILTSDERVNIRQVTLEFGASDYLVKGHSTSGELRRALRNAVQRGWPKIRQSTVGPMYS
jgi:DNA-binding response OmpR family regulator